MDPRSTVTERTSRLRRLVAPADLDDVAIGRRSLELLASIILVLSPIWVVVYTALGRPEAGAIPGVYWGATAIGLILLRRTQRYDAFAWGQVALMLVLPFLLQWALGGFVNGSAVGIWAFVAPLAALVWLGTRRAFLLFIAFLTLTAISGVIDPWLAAAAVPVPEAVRLAFFVMNVCGVAITTYVTLLFFVRGRDAARARSDELLLNVMPAVIAERLKRGEPRVADTFDEVTVLFADIVDFTGIAARQRPTETYDLLDTVFSALDALATRHRLEKIKTLGDAYMAVAGVPLPCPDHADRAAEMALDLQAAVDAAVAPTGPAVRMRIGIHTGPVMAGVIGRRTFAYDLWGDAVNIASRMESHGLPGAIQVSDAAYQLLRARYTFEQRGTIEVKGKGEMRTWLLTGRRAAAARDGVTDDRAETRPATQQADATVPIGTRGSAF